MKDIDRSLERAFRDVRDRYRTGQQARRARQRARFVERYRRRRWLVPTVSIATAGAAVIVGIFVASRLGDVVAPERTRVAGIEGVSAFIGVGRDPADVGVGLNDVWIANEGGGTITRVDPNTNALVQVITIEGRPSEVDLGEDALWVTDSASGTLIKIDPVTGTEDEQRVRVAEPGNALGLSVGDGYAWVVVKGDKLVRVDAGDPRSVQRFPAGAPVDVAARDGVVWVLDEEGLVKMTPGGEIVGAPIKFPGVSGDVYAGENELWLANTRQDTVTRINAATNEFAGTLGLLGAYIDMALSEDAVWVLSSNGKPRLERFDPETTDREGSLELKGDPAEVSTGHGSVWVADRANSAVYRIDPSAVD